MYKAEEEQVVIEDEEITLYGVKDEDRFYCSFTDSRETAENFAEFLNENGVEACHVYDIIEDMFYSG